MCKRERFDFIRSEEEGGTRWKISRHVSVYISRYVRTRDAYVRIFTHTYVYYGADTVAWAYKGDSRADSPSLLPRPFSLARPA